MLLECGRDGGFARGGETREPDCAALLLAEGVALRARERRVPGDVAGRCFVRVDGWMGVEAVESIRGEI